MVADWFLLRRAGNQKVHRTQFVRGTLQGYLVPVAIGLATFVVVGAYFLFTRGVLLEGLLVPPTGYSYPFHLDQWRYL